MTPINPTFTPRKTAPTKPTSRDFAGPYFLVWANSPIYDEDPKPWKCCAAFTFTFLGDALDYIAELQDRQVEPVFQSPTGCQVYAKGSRRAVNNETSGAALDCIAELSAKACA